VDRIGVFIDQRGLTASDAQTIEVFLAAFAKLSVVEGRFPSASPSASRIVSAELPKVASGDASIRPMRVTQNPANEAGPDWHSRRRFQSLRAA